MLNPTVFAEGEATSPLSKGEGYAFTPSFT